MSPEPEYRFDDLPPYSTVEREPQIAAKTAGELVAFTPSEGIQLTPGRFPIEAFPPLLRNVAKELSLVYQTPVCLPAISALGVISGAVGSSVVVRGAYKDKATRLNLYIVAVAERGSGKGNIGELLCEPMSRRSTLLLERHRQAVAESRGELGVLKKEVGRLEQKAAGVTGDERANLLETLANRQHRLAELESDAGRETALLVSDTTSEALGRMLSDNHETLFSYSSEAGAAVKVALGKYCDTGDFDLLLSGYSGDSVRTTRVGRRTVELKRPCLSLLWLVQDCVLRQLVGDTEAVSRGLTARILIFDTTARREYDNRESLSFEREEEWGRAIDQILDQRFPDAPAREISCSSAAREIFAKFNDESVTLERGPFVTFTGELSRWRENAIKVAGLFAVADNALEITEDIAKRAVSLVRWCGLNYLGMLQTGERGCFQEDLKRVREILIHANGELNVGKLASHHSIDRKEVETLVRLFPDEMRIDRRNGTGGRPAEILCLVSKASKQSNGSA